MDDAMIVCTSFDAASFRRLSKRMKFPDSLPGKGFEDIQNGANPGDHLICSIFYSLFYLESFIIRLINPRLPSQSPREIGR